MQQSECHVLRAAVSLSPPPHTHTSYLPLSQYCRFPLTPNKFDSSLTSVRCALRGVSGEGAKSV